MFFNWLEKHTPNAQLIRYKTIVKHNLDMMQPFFEKEKYNAGLNISIHNIYLKHNNKTDTKQKQRSTTRGTDQVCDRLH